MGDRLNYTFHIDPDCQKSDPFIPNMILQPVLENAIWHGIAPLEAGGEIPIRVFREDAHHLIITVRDNGVGISDNAKSEFIRHDPKGLQMIQRQLELHHPDNKLEMTSNDGQRGTRVKYTLHIPS